MAKLKERNANILQESGGVVEAYQTVLQTQREYLYFTVDGSFKMTVKKQIQMAGHEMFTVHAGRLLKIMSAFDQEEPYKLHATVRKQESAVS